MPDNPLTIEQVLTLLIETPQSIKTLTAGLSPAQLRTPPEPGEWPATGVLAHLRSCADVWGNCIATIISEDKPTIRAVNPTNWIKKTDYFDLEFKPSFDGYLNQRDELVQVLKQLPPESWSRPAIVTGAGNVLERTVFFYARWLARHERTHVRQFQKIVKASVQAL